MNIGFEVHVFQPSGPPDAEPLVFSFQAHLVPILLTPENYHCCTSLKANFKPVVWQFSVLMIKLLAINKVCA